MFFPKVKHQTAPDVTQAGMCGKSSTLPLSAGGTIEFLAGEEESHIPLSISSVWADSNGSPCVSLQRTPGMFTLPEIEPGSNVAFYTFQGGNRPARCTGVVLSASRIKADIGNLTIEEMTERRSEFRLPLICDVTMFSKDDPEKKDKFEAAMINISSDGMSFSTRKDLEEGSIYGTTFRLYSGGSWTTCYGLIIWKKPLSFGKTRYGMIFSMLEEQLKADLISEIFKTQQMRRNR